jgi:hypothetical protein
MRYRSTRFGELFEDNGGPACRERSDELPRTSW